MFCPKCGAQNESDLRYCRRCGLTLSRIWLALDGNPDESFEKLKASEKWINIGITAMAVFTIAALALMIIGGAVSDPGFSNSIALLSILLGMAFGLPLVFLGKVNLKQAARFLAGSRNGSRESVLDRAKWTDRLHTTSIDADPPGPPVPASVTEQTTTNLREPQHGRRETD